MKKWLISLILVLALTSPAYSQFGSGLIERGPSPVRSTDCSGYITKGQLCYDTDDLKMYVGNGTIATEISTSAVYNFNATLSSIHTFTDANWNDDDVTWTMTGTGPLVHVTGNTTAVTATTSEAIVAGTTYKVTITGTGGGDTASYTLGAVAGTMIAASGTIAITDWITASTSGALIITPASTCTVSISSVTVQKLVAATGDLTVDGNLTVHSPATFDDLLTTRDLITKGPWVDPRSFGADCTGTTDASSVFTTIVASFTSQGSIYIGKDCIYKLNTAVAIGSKTVSIFGGGGIKLGADAYAFSVDGGILKIEGINFTTSTSATGNVATALSASKGIFINNTVTSLKGGFGNYWNNSVFQGNKISLLPADATGSYAIHFAGSKNIVIGNNITGGRHHVYISGGTLTPGEVVENNLVSNNIFNTPGRCGVQVYALSSEGAVQYNEVSNNIIIDAGQHGINVTENAKYNKVVGNIINGFAAGYGILIEGVVSTDAGKRPSNNYIEGNTIISKIANDTTYHNIYVLNAFENTILNNTLTRPTTDISGSTRGIQLDSQTTPTASLNKVIGNNFTFCMLNNASVTNTQIYGNSFYVYAGVFPIFIDPSGSANIGENIGVDSNGTPLSLSPAATKDSVNPKAPGQAVNMTAAASGSSGITVADNDNIDFGTGNFTLGVKILVPFWGATAGIQTILDKYSNGSTGYYTTITASGKVNIVLVGVGGSVKTFACTSTTGFVDGTEHEITHVITRETAVVNGSISVYYDGILVETTVISAGSGGSIDSGQALNIMGVLNSGKRTAGTISHTYTFNRALTAAEVLDLYRNGPAFSDKWGSQTSLITGNDSTFAGASNWANVDLNAYDETTDLTITASAAGQYCTLPVANAGTTANKKYRLEMDAANLVSTWTIKSFDGTQTIGTVSVSGANQKFEFTASTTGGLRLVAVANDSSGDFDNFLFYPIGATLALEEKGIKTPKWFDSSTNALDASYPATGSSLTLDYQLGTESLLSITNVSFAGNGDTTLYTVPTGRRLVLTKAIVIAGADAGATTALSIGADATETDFVPAAVLSNLDAAYDVVILQPVPVAALPAKNKSYAAGTVIQGQVATQSGGATNSVQLFGILY